MTIQQTIHAQISPNILNKVTRLFNASLEDILAELLQNARRAGATAVYLTVDNKAEPTLTVTDDGVGVSNPQDLLSLGDSGWHDDTLQQEDPAGMGVFSLSSRGASIRSKDWTICLNPDHFTGSPVVITSVGQPIDGTAITLPLTADEGEYFARILARDELILEYAKYYPLPVYLNGQRVWQQDFLADALFVEQWQGLRIGVIKQRDWKSRFINFHGLTLYHALPIVEGYTVYVEVLDAPELHLVLPARKEMVHNDFAKDLHEQCLRTLYRYFASLKEHTLSYDDWCKAQQLGVLLPEATPELQKVQLKAADDYALTPHEPEAVNVTHRNVIVADFFESVYDDFFAWQNCFVQTLNSPLNANRQIALKGYIFVQSNPAYVGYSWYDALPRLTDVNFTVSKDTKGAVSQEDNIVSDVVMTCTIISQDGQITSETCSAPIYFTIDNHRYPTLDDIAIVLHGGHSFNPWDLADFLEMTFFRMHEDGETDSYSTQQEYFRDEAIRRSMALLLSEDEALQHHLKGVAAQHMRWELPGNRTAILRVSESGIKVRLLPKKKTG